MSITERLEELLLDNGVGPRQVRSTIAKICGISAQAVHQWWGPTKSPTSANLAAVASRYNADLLWLTTGEGKMYSSLQRRSERAFSLYHQYSELSAQDKQSFLDMVEKS